MTASLLLQEVVFATNVSAGRALGDEPTQHLAFVILDCRMTAGVPPVGAISGFSSCTVDASSCELVCTSLDGSKQRPPYFSNLTFKATPAENGAAAGMMGVVSFTSFVTTWAVQPTLEIRLMLVDDGPGDYPSRNFSEPAVLRLILVPRNHEPYFAPSFNSTVPIEVCVCPHDVTAHPPIQLTFPLTHPSATLNPQSVPRALLSSEQCLICQCCMFTRCQGAVTVNCPLVYIGLNHLHFDQL